MMGRYRHVFVAMLVITVLGCSHRSGENQERSPFASGMVCTDELRAGITVEVRDALTGTPAACGASGEARDGTYIAPLTDEGRCTEAPMTWAYLTGAWERAGVYTVAIRKPGYRDWVQEQVVVTADACHVQPVSLQANLESE